MKFRIFTDGACSENPGPGGWAAIMNLKEGQVVLKGYETSTTNNRMELMAVVEVLSEIMKHGIEGFDKSKDKIEVISDSAYVVNAINDKWTVKWRLNGWKTTKGKDVKNRELWEELTSLLMSFKSDGIKVSFVKVKGHDGNVFNEAADEIARKQVEIAKRVILAEEAFEEAIS